MKKRRFEADPFRINRSGFGNIEDRFDPFDVNEQFSLDNDFGFSEEQSIFGGLGDEKFTQGDMTNVADERALSRAKRKKRNRFLDERARVVQSGGQPITDDEVERANRNQNLVGGNLY